MESGEGGEFIKINRHTTRRHVVKGAAALGALAATGVGAKEVLERIRDKKVENDPKDILKDEWSESIVGDPTPGHLFDRYYLNNESVDKTHFPQESDFRNFTENIAKLAKRINSDNPNLGNQLAAVIFYETKGTFSSGAESADRPGKGLFLLTDANVSEFGFTAEDVGTLSPDEQLTLFGKVLEREKKKSGEEFNYFELSDLMVSKMAPSFIGSENTDVVWMEGLDAYTKNKEFDQDEDGEITKGEVGETVKFFAVDHGEVDRFLDNPHPPTKEPESSENEESEIEEDPYKDDPTDDELEKETKADIETAPYLKDIYSDAMKDKYFTSDERKMNFMRELTRVAARLNPENPNLANQIAAVINFETAGTFSSSVQNPGSSATGLIQFMDFIAEEYGTTCEKLAKMSPLKQLSYVEKYFRDKQEMAHANEWRGLWDISDVYMAVFWPAGMGIENDEALFNQDTDEYSVNSVLDVNGDGVITKEEATKRVFDLAKDWKENPDYLVSPRG